MLVIFFWILWLLMFVFGVAGWRGTPDEKNRWGGGYSFVVWILIGILGYKLFGNPFQ